MKKIKLIIEDTTKKRYISIPITRAEISSIFHIQFCLSPGQNALARPVLGKINKAMDALDEGKCYEFKDGKFKATDVKYYYSGRPPRWKKQK